MAASSRVEHPPDEGRRRLRPLDRRLRALRADDRPGLSTARPAERCRCRRGRPLGAPLVGRPARDRPRGRRSRRARPSPRCTRRCTGCRSSLVAEAGRLRGIAAEIRDRGRADDPDGATGRGRRLLARGRPPTSPSRTGASTRRWPRARRPPRTSREPRGSAAPDRCWRICRASAPAAGDRPPTRPR